MKIEDNTVIRGLKLISDDQEMLCDEMWCTYRPKDGTWKTKTLKNNEQIIGLEVNTQENDNAIQLRWILGAATDKAADEAKNYVTTGSWRPKLLKSAVFGMPQYTCNARSLKDVRELHKFNAPPKIKKIKYKCTDNNEGLQGMQLIFDNGFKTPMLQTYNGETGGWDIKTVEVDDYNYITQIGLKYDDGVLSALKFETDECDTCLNVRWNTYRDGGSWKYVDIENNNAIVGICADLDCEPGDDGIHKLGFMLATEENCITEPPKAPTEISENILSFGNSSDYPLAQKYPKSANDLKKMTQPVKLTAIKWKQYRDDDVLCAI